VEEIGSSAAVINKIQTTADGGARITLDIPSHETKIITDLMRLKLENQPLLQIGLVSVRVD